MVFLVCVISYAKITTVNTENTPVVTPKKKSGFKKFIRWAILICVLVLAVLIWWNYYFVFGEGVKSGELNYLVKKGNVFKTYEGKLIQSGLRSKTAGTVQSYEFEFSVVNDSIANILIRGNSVSSEALDSAFMLGNASNTAGATLLIFLSESCADKTTITSS